jgi:hypothetical protein
MDTSDWPPPFTVSIQEGERDCAACTISPNKTLLLCRGMLDFRLVKINFKEIVDAAIRKIIQPFRTEIIEDINAWY